MVEEGADEAAIEAKRQAMQEEIDAVPLTAIPAKKKKQKDKDKATDRKAEDDKEKPERPQVVLLNEEGTPAGKFGWCVACRGTAGLYCKHTRHPVCSFECKQAHLKMLEEAAE